MGRGGGVRREGCLSIIRSGRSGFCGVCAIGVGVWIRVGETIGGDEVNNNKTEQTVSFAPVFIKAFPNMNMHKLINVPHSPISHRFSHPKPPPHSLTSPHQHEREHKPSLAPDTDPLPLT